MSIRELLFGSPLRTEEEQQEQIGPLEGVPVLGLDALASASYGPEAALTVLLPLGVAAPGYIGPIILAVIVVLVAASISYRQTIAAYPQGGGSFTVAKENLGLTAGLIAASALSIDYVLNVAVAISAGVGALVSMAPRLLPYTLWLCLGVLALLAVVNLRGIRSAGLVFTAPTYLFVLCLGATIFIGVWKTMAAHGHPAPAVPPPHPGPPAAAVSLWLLLRSFASGCTALTGIEAVSNAVPVFRRPTVPLARRTLTIIAGLLVFLLCGVAFLSHSYGIGATHPGRAGYQSVLSQLVSAVTGRGIFYYVTMGVVVTVLALSANTSFADFPRVCRVLALDEFLPAEFAHRGSRLVYSSGIIVLTVLSALLLVIFGGITDRLIPLFAVGAFLAFTLSQLGMVAHWWRSKEPHAKRSLGLNAVGALATAFTLVIIAGSKFTEGAWATVLVIPPMVVLFWRIRKYHENLDRQIDTARPLRLDDLTPPIIIIPMKRLDRVAQKALRLGLTLSNEVIALQVLSEEMKTADLTECWGRLVEEPARSAGRPAPRLVVVPSAYREFFGPLLNQLKKLSQEHSDRWIAVLLPEVVERRWYHFLFRHRNTVLKGLLLMNGGPRIVLITAPWYVRDTAPGTRPEASSEQRDGVGQQGEPASVGG